VKLLRLPGKKKETSLDLNNQIIPSSSAAAIFSTLLNRIPKVCLQTRKIRHKEENSTQSLFAHQKKFATKKRIPHKACLHTRKNSPQKEENSTQSLFAQELLEYGNSKSKAASTSLHRDGQRVCLRDTACNGRRRKRRRRRTRGVVSATRSESGSGWIAPSAARGAYHVHVRMHLAPP
jgi:hypothetical protein